MSCECQQDLFDCEQKVRRFLGAGRPDGIGDLLARDQLIERMRPLIERIVASKLQGKWRQDRASVVQDTVLKLLNPTKIRTWLDSPKRTWFCHWVVVVAYHTAIDHIRRSGAPPEGRAPTANAPAGPETLYESAKQAEELREAIIAALADFELDWQLVFCMKFSYFEPSVSEIAHAVEIAEETVFFRLRKMKKQVACRCEPYLPAVGPIVPPAGTCHPVPGFDGLEPDKRRRINEAILKLLTARAQRVQYAFYMTYSPLAAPPNLLAVRTGEDEKTVRGWLADLEDEIQRLCRRDQC